MKKKMIWGIIAVVFLVVLGFAWFSSNSEGASDGFAQCLTDSGVKMYGAYWCPHCQSQKNLFGSSWKHVNYIECSLPNQAGQTQECIQEGIQGYPTWEFSDGNRVSGELGLQQLSQLSGCSLEA